MKSQKIFFLTLLVSSYGFAEESVVSGQQQAINAFSNCVNQVVANGDGHEAVDSQCSTLKATLDEVAPGLADNIVHTIIQGASTQ